MTCSGLSYFECDASCGRVPFFLVDCLSTFLIEEKCIDDYVELEVQCV